MERAMHVRALPQQMAVGAALRNRLTIDRERVAKPAGRGSICTVHTTIRVSHPNTGAPRKIVVKGTSGAGKSTFAAELACRLHLAYVELDALHHGPNWSEPTPEEFRARVSGAMTASPRGWVIDGNYDTKLGETVVDAADTIVWLDLPLWIKLRRVWRRTLHRIRDDVELWGGNRETWRDQFLSRQSIFIWTIHAHVQHRRRWPARFGQDDRLVRLRSVTAIHRWLDEEANA
jgi:adenylate kinase family enzyme